MKIVVLRSRLEGSGKKTTLPILFATFPVLPLTLCLYFHPYFFLSYPVCTRCNKREYIIYNSLWVIRNSNSICHVTQFQNNTILTI